MIIFLRASKILYQKKWRRYEYKSSFFRFVSREILIILIIKKGKKRSIFIRWISFHDFERYSNSSLDEHLAEYSLDWSQGSIKACNKRSNESDESASQA